MSFSYIEEDFRYATELQVDSYSEAEQEEKPHMAGYELIQLLDQMNGHWLKTPANRCVFYMQTLPGTAYWLVKHWEQEDHKPQFILILERAVKGNWVWQYLAQQPNVTLQTPTLEELDTVTCQVVTVQTEIQSRLVYNKPSIIYDPRRMLSKEPGGEYFMNSTIWVTRHGN